MVLPTWRTIRAGAARAARGLDRVATPRRVLVAGWLVFLVYAYPGYLSPDPVEQLHQARVGVYGNAHPPAMAFLWHLVECVVSGPFGMLVLQSVALLAGLAGVLRAVFARRTAAFLAVAILLSPPVLVTMAVIWKDSQMAGYAMAGIACLLSPRRGWRLVGCALLALATAMRINAAAATLPAVVLLFVWTDGLRWWKRYAIAFAMWLAIAGSAVLATRQLTDVEQYPWYGGALYDIAGTLHYGRAHADVTIERMLPGVVHVRHDINSRIAEQYVGYNGYGIVHGDARIFDYPDSDARRAVVERAWWKLVKNDWRGYLRHRLEVATELLGFYRGGFGAVWTGLEHGKGYWERVDVAMSQSDVQTLWVGVLHWLRGSLMFRPYCYFAIALALLALARARLAIALVASGLLYECSLFAGAGSADYRYSHWMITCTIVAGVMTAVARYRAGRRATR